SGGVAAAGAVPVIPSPATDVGVLTHGVVVAVGRPAAWSRLGEQRRSGTAHDGQGLNGLTLHHANICQYAVMAAQAKEDDRVSVMGAGETATRRQRDRVG